MQVSPTARKRINPIVQHYGKMAHPFTACVRDNTKRFGPERAKRICAVVKDMARGGTGWRGETKDSEAIYREAMRLADEALASLHRVEGIVGRRGVRILVRDALTARGDDGTISEDEQHRLGEHLLADLVVLETIARPRDAEVVWRAVLHDHEIAEAVLSAGARKQLPKSAFVFPAEKRYPIHDRAHAANALARSSGKPEAAKVKAAVCSRYPDLPACGKGS
jgi:hypothetical protein